MSDKSIYISEHFTRSEFECRCGCGFATADVKLVEILEWLRNHFDAPIKINSACRCKIYNKSVGGAPNSKHLEGLAADISVFGVDPEKVQDKFNEKYKDKYGLGRYSNFTHIDSRSKKARW